jgi:hypothetical protein
VVGDIFDLYDNARTYKPYIYKLSLLISNFRRVLNAVLFLLGDFPASEFSLPTFRNTLSHLHGPFKQEEYDKPSFLPCKCCHLTVLRLIIPWMLTYPQRVPQREYCLNHENSSCSYVAENNSLGVYHEHENSSLTSLVTMEATAWLKHSHNGIIWLRSIRAVKLTTHLQLVSKNGVAFPWRPPPPSPKILRVWRLSELSKLTNWYVWICLVHFHVLPTSVRVYKYFQRTLIPEILLQFALFCKPFKF